MSEMIDGWWCSEGDRARVAIKGEEEIASYIVADGSLFASTRIPGPVVEWLVQPLIEKGRSNATRLPE